MSNKSLKASVIIGGSVSSAFRNAMATTKNGLKAIGEEIANVERRQRLLGRGIETFGKMGRNVDGMRKQYAALTREADKLRAAQSRLAGVQGRIDRNNARRRELGGKFAGAVGTFGVVAAATLAPVRSAVAFESAMLGVAKQVQGARDAGGNLTPVYFAMAKQVQQLGREIPIATNELAEMVAAGARMGVANKELIQFTRTAAMMADAFELPAGALADDMGKIAGLFHIPIPRIGELADAINFLDDNAISKGGEIIDVMRRVGGMARTLKMPAKEAAALGSTFLSLGSQAEVAGTATNAMLQILGAASVQSKRVRNGLDSIGFKPEDIQSSMAKDPTGTILKLLDALSKLSDEQRMVATARIFGKEYGDDIAKLATGTAEYRRQLALVNSEQSKGSMSREFQARLKTTAAQWQLTKNRMTSMAVAVGGVLLPAINELMKSAAPMVDKFAAFARDNPGVIKGVVGTALALSALRVAATGAAYGLAILKTPLLGTLGFIARWRADGAIKAMGKFGPTAGRAATGLRAVGVAIAAIGGGPIAIAVAALTVGALVVRKYWQPIAAFVTGAFEGIRTAVGPAFAELGAALAPLKPVWDGITGAVTSAFNWFMKLLTPVNMTAQQLKAAGDAGRGFGSVIGGVMAFVIRRVTDVVNAIKWVVNNIGKVAKFATMIPGPAGLAGAAFTATAAMFGDPAAPKPAGVKAPTRGKRPPAVPASAARGGGQASATSSHVYHITQQPGESGEALARRIAEQQNRQAGVARRGSLVDGAS